MFFVVANAAGISEYVKVDDLQVGFDAASLEVGMQAITITVPCLASSSSPPEDIWVPKAFTQLTRSCKPLPWLSTPFQVHYGFAIPDCNSFQSQWNSAGMWYTDGSCRDVDGRRIIGAGVCCPSRGLAGRVSCAGVGATNTINRAEMCAGLHCLKRAGLEANGVMATDSQVTMCSLNCHIRSPVLNVFNKHKALLDAMSTVPFLIIVLHN